MIKFLLIFILFILLSSSFMYNITKKILKKIIHHNLSFYISIFHSILFLFIIRLILEINILKEGIYISETNTFDDDDDEEEHNHSFNSTNYDELYQGISGDIIYNDDLDQDLLKGNELINIVNNEKKKNNLLKYAQLYKSGQENTITNLSNNWNNINSISWNDVKDNHDNIIKIINKKNQIDISNSELESEISRLEDDKVVKERKLVVAEKAVASVEEAAAAAALEREKRRFEKEQKAKKQYLIAQKGKNIGNIIARGTSKMFNNAVRGVKNIPSIPPAPPIKINNPVKIPRRFPRRLRKPRWRR